MVFIKIITAVTGLTFLLFGYLIYGKKKYHLINDFEADRQAGHKDEQYAKPLLTVSIVLAMMGLISSAPDYMDVVSVLRKAPRHALIRDSMDGLYFYIP